MIAVNFLALSAFLASPLAKADTQLSTLKNIQNIEDGVTLHWERVPTPPEVKEQITKFSSDFSLGERINIDLDTITNIGKNLWQVINDNAPVATLQHDYATGLPKGITSAGDLENFSDLNYETWRFWGSNPFGSTLYEVEYTLVHQYGGSYEGRGKYLATVTVLPSKVDVTWGYKINMKAAQVSSLNVGTVEDPIASVTLELSYDVRSFLRSVSARKLFQFRGDTAEIISTNL